MAWQGFPLEALDTQQRFHTHTAAPKWTIMKQLRMRSFVSATITDITLFTQPRWSMNWPGLFGGGGVLRIKMRLGSDQVRHGYLRDFVPRGRFSARLHPRDKHLPFNRRTKREKSICHHHVIDEDVLHSSVCIAPITLSSSTNF